MTGRIRATLVLRVIPFLLCFASFLATPAHAESRGTVPLGRGAHLEWWRYRTRFALHDGSDESRLAAMTVLESAMPNEPEAVQVFGTLSEDGKSLVVGDQRFSAVELLRVLERNRAQLYPPEDMQERQDRYDGAKAIVLYTLEGHLTSDFCSKLAAVSGKPVLFNRGMLNYRFAPDPWVVGKGKPLGVWVSDPRSGPRWGRVLPQGSLSEYSPGPRGRSQVETGFHPPIPPGAEEKFGYPLGTKYGSTIDYKDLNSYIAKLESLNSTAASTIVKVKDEEGIVHQVPLTHTAPGFIPVTPYQPPVDPATWEEAIKGLARLGARLIVPKLFATVGEYGGTVLTRKVGENLGEKIFGPAGRDLGRKIGRRVADHLCEYGALAPKHRELFPQMHTP